MTPLPTKEPETLEEMQKLYPDLPVIERSDFPPEGAPNPLLVRGFAVWKIETGAEQLGSGIYLRKAV
jgi:hypothetical protein